MTASVRVPVLNSLLYIKDPTVDDFPEIDSRSPLWSTPACVAVCCLPDCDGETEVTLGPAREVALARAPVFDGGIETPSRRVVVKTVLDETILQMAVATLDSRIRIWTNGLLATDTVIIGVG